MKSESFDLRHNRDYLWLPILKLLEKNKITSVLNVGGGASIEWIDLVIKYNLKLHIIDEYEGHGSSSNNVNILDEIIKVKKLSNNITYEKADAVTWVPKTCTYDLVYARNALHHIIKYSEFSEERFICLFKNLNDYLKKGGFLYIREAGRINYLQHLGRILPDTLQKMNYTTKTNINEYIRYLNKVDFEVIEKKYYVPYKLRLFKPLLSNRIANIFLTSAYMILAQKKV